MQVYLEVKCGSIHELEQEQGIAHFVEHVSLSDTLNKLSLLYCLNSSYFGCSLESEWQPKPCDKVDCEFLKSVSRLANWVERKSNAL